MSDRVPDQAQAVPRLGLSIVSALRNLLWPAVVLACPRIPQKPNAISRPTTRCALRRLPSENKSDCSVDGESGDSGHWRLEILQQGMCLSGHGPLSTRCYLRGNPHCFCSSAPSPLEPRQSLGALGVRHSGYHDTADHPESSRLNR